MSDINHIEHEAGWGDDVYSKLSWFRRDRVSSAKVLVAGCGALGNEVVKNLALFGVGHITLVDFDRVERSNLTRSILFSREDADMGRPKVDVLARRVREINPGVDVQPLFGDVAYDVGLGVLRRMDVVIGCVDSRWTRYCINRLCMRAGVPWVDGGIEGLDGTVRVFAPERNCYACNLGVVGRAELSRRISCPDIVRKNEAAGRAATTPVIASIIGAVQVQETLKLIHKEQIESGELSSLCGRIFHYEGQHLTTKTAQFEAFDDDCAAHECWKNIIPSNATVDNTVGEALATFKNELHCDRVAIVLRNDCFVDYVEYRTTGEQRKVMSPGRMVADKFNIGDDDGAIYQHEYRTFDSDFPYMDLTLRQTGVPDNDVLQVRTEQGDCFMELMPVTNERCQAHKLQRLE